MAARYYFELLPVYLSIINYYDKPAISDTRGHYLIRIPGPCLLKEQKMLLKEYQ